MGKDRAETILEETRLRETIAVAEAQLAQARESLQEKEQAILEAKRDIREHATHGVTGLTSSDDFEAIVELSQCIGHIEESVLDHDEEARRIRRLEKIIESPYFARIDFRFEGESQAEQVYIGRSSLTEKKTREFYVYDWRSPIASIFYRCMPGKAFYEAPGGRIEGELTLKRQYEIEKGALEFYFDADRNISDAFLRQLLSQNTSPQMKAIVETIQKEQDIVIRNMENDLLMVQGVAGSGKTSIALHRAAYLMYQGLQSNLSANNIMILSPNSVFEQYISSVLPELGEENVGSATFDDILRKILKGQRAESRNTFLEHLMTDNAYQSVIQKSAEFKMSETFRRMLDDFLPEIPLRWIPFQDLHYNGSCIVTGEEMRLWTMRRPHIPLGTRLLQLEDYCLEKIFGTARKRGDGEQRNLIRQEIRQFTELDVVSLYGRIFSDFHGRDQDIPADIREFTLSNLNAGQLCYDDATAAAYLHLKIYGDTEYRSIRQVVIDEAQDYYTLQYEIFRLLFPNARFTVLGDINQTLAKPESLSLYEEIQRILDRKNAGLVMLDKSFRCTNEILDFSLQFIDCRPQIESFNRSGDRPEILTPDSHDKLLDGILQETILCREKGLESIGLICKTAKKASQLYEDLKKRIKLRLIKDSMADSLKGIFIMPAYLSKGLEFDAVIICDAVLGDDCTEEDKKLLYVECTRALHRLLLICPARNHQ